MTLRCSKCGSLNIDSMSTCGKCGTQLTQSDRLVVQKTQNTEYYNEYNEPIMSCPYCGRPMDEGTLEIPAHQILRPRWLGSHDDEPKEVVEYGPSFYVLEGYRCRECGCMLLCH